MSKEPLKNWLRQRLKAGEEEFEAIWSRLEERRWLAEYDQGLLSEADLLDEASSMAEFIHRVLPTVESPGRTLPPSRDDRKAPREVSVELDEYSQKRARTFSEVAAALAEGHPEVKEFRAEFLGSEDTRLTEEQAGEMLYVEDLPLHIFDRLHSLAKRLSRAYRWRLDAAKWFVLTGDAPYVQPLTVHFSHNISNEDHYPNTAEITMIVEPWVDAKDVERVYREVQRQVLGGDKRKSADNRKKKKRTLDAVGFAARQIRENGTESWQELTRRWKRSQRDPRRHYKSRGGLRQAFKRFVRPAYNQPIYKPIQPEPWQVQRDKARRRFIEDFKKHGPPQVGNKKS